MRPPSVYANPTCPAACPCDLLHLLHGPHRLACRLLMILLSQQGWTAVQIADLLGYDPSTVRRWIHRYQRHGAAALADRPRSGRPRLGSPKLTQRIRRLLTQPRAWTIPRLWQALGRPPISLRTCTGGWARSQHGGGPAWSPRAIPTVTRPSPTSTSSSATCPTARSCWPKTRPTSTCCHGSAPPGSSRGPGRRS
jgi:hypothetical protein